MNALADLLDDPRLALGAAGAWTTSGFPLHPDPGTDVRPTFFLGAPHAHWLRHARVPLFLSHNTLRKCQWRIPRPRGPWALDSGGFTEITAHGRWLTGAADYAEAIVRYFEQSYGTLVFASPQDWMCEPWAIHGGKTPQGLRAPGTGLSVREHQVRTVDNLLELRARLECHGLERVLVPALQGYEPEEYLQHVDDYARAGVDLRTERLVGLGSVCRRQDTGPIHELVRDLHAAGIRLHGYGVSRRGLAQLAPYLASADSMAWSLSARMADGPISRHCDHRRCTTCPLWASAWRTSLLDELRVARAGAAEIAAAA